MTMKKILNEWKVFLKESKEEDREIASSILAMIDPKSIATQEATEFLRANKKRASRVIRSYLDGDESVFSVSPRKDVVRVGKNQHYFPKKDFFSRLGGMLEILEDSRSKFDFSMFDGSVEPRDSPYPGKYGPKDHSGGATDTGIVVPDKATDEEKAPIVANMNKYKSYYMYKAEDHVMSSIDYEKSLSHLITAYEGLYGLWKKYSPMNPEFIKVKDALISATNARLVGIEMSDEERADQHMKTGNELLANNRKESAMEFRNAKALYTKLGMADKAKEANMLFRQARRIR